MSDKVLLLIEILHGRSYDIRKYLNQKANFLLEPI